MSAFSKNEIPFIIPNWAEEARYLLIQKAEEGGTVEYQVLYDELLSKLGSEPPGLWRVWIATVLGEVAKLNLAHGEPLLSSLVVGKQTHEVGDGYATAAMVRYGYTPHNVTVHAHYERVASYATFRGRNFAIRETGVEKEMMSVHV